MFYVFSVKVEACRKETTSNIKTESRHATAAAVLHDLEPELFQFNESFDVNLLNLKLHGKSRLVDQANFDLLHSPCSSSSSSISQLYRNLNKLYHNEQINSQSINNQHQAQTVADHDLLMDASSDLFQLDDFLANNTIRVNENIGSNTLICFSASSMTQKADDFACEAAELEEDFYNDMMNGNDQLLFNAADQTTVLSSSFKIAEEESERFLFKPSFFRIVSPKGVNLNSTFNTSHHTTSRKCRAKLNQNNKRKRRAVKKINFKKANTVKKSSVNLKSKPIQTILANIQPAFCKIPQKTGQQIYKRSFKIEKLLNDSRGMKKYLLDYDGLFMNNNNQVNLPSCQENIQADYDDQLSVSSASSFVHNDLYHEDLALEFDVETLIGLDLPKKSSSFSSNSSSNRCSSGYLSD